MASSSTPRPSHDKVCNWAASRLEDTAGTLLAAGGQTVAQLASLPANCVRALAVARVSTGPANTNKNISANIQRKYFSNTFSGIILLNCNFTSKYCPAAGHLDTLNFCKTGESILGRNYDCQHCLFRHWSSACQVTPVTPVTQDRTAFNRKYFSHLSFPAPPILQ